MGMFDTVKCRYPLPLPEYQEREFQTKDTPCQLYEYEIAANGHLFRKEDGALMRYKFTGWINFYTSDREWSWRYDRDFMNLGWIEFKAEFARGALLDIQLVEQRKAEPIATPPAATLGER